MIIPLTKEIIPTEKDGWNFNWRREFSNRPKTIFVLIAKNSNKLHGIIQLINDEGMLIMESIEIAPFNFGSKEENGRVAGCLIAFGCRESLKLENAYKGYLTFVSKTTLIDIYRTKNNATQAIGRRID